MGGWVELGRGQGELPSLDVRGWERTDPRRCPQPEGAESSGGERGWENPELQVGGGRIRMSMMMNLNTSFSGAFRASAARRPRGKIRSTHYK